MISKKFCQDVFIADFTNYVNGDSDGSVPYKGVIVDTEENGIIPSFLIHNKNGFPFFVVNNEHNLAVFKRPNGTLVSQCECIIFAERNDNRRGWMIFLELKYCEPKNLYMNILKGISQLKTTCNYIIHEKNEFDGKQFKIYFVVSTPGTEPLDPFDAFYFNQDDILNLYEETGAKLMLANEVYVKTPALVES